MLEISSQEFQRHIGKYQDHVKYEPITVLRHNRRSLVVMSAETYDNIRKSQRRRSFHVNELSEKQIAIIGASKMSHEYDYLNAELEN
jgi:prevent-host-death family protein